MSGPESLLVPRPELLLEPLRDQAPLDDGPSPRQLAKALKSITPTNRDKVTGT